MRQLYILFTIALCRAELFPDQQITDGHCDSSNPHEYCHQEFVVKLKNDDIGIIKEFARKHALIYDGKVGSLDYHTFRHASDRDHRTKRYIRESLAEDDRVSWSMGQSAKIRVKRDYVRPEDKRHRRSTKQDPVPSLPFRDPFYHDQWYLHNGASGGSDMGVIGAWRLGYAGRNVSISILDDGIQPDHPDLQQNYDPLASTDINDKDDDPTPRDNGDNKHGTRCAGEVSAVAGNDYCGVGAAFHSKIGGVRMLDGPVSDRVEAASLSHNPHHIDVYSASWGPEDDGRTFDGPGPLAKDAFFKGITNGRGGKGNIFVWASGNGGSHRDSCSCDGYTTSIYTLSISSATFSNTQPWYLEECPSTLATTYSSGSYGQPAIVTTDMPSKCTKQHTGTSASAPLAAGIVALALEANPNLTWRDMQHCVLRSANPRPLISNGGWTVNGVNRKISNKFGYGLLDAGALVKVAKNWVPVGEQKTCTYEYDMIPPNPRPLIGRAHYNFTLTVHGCQDTEHEVRYLEHIQAVITIRFSRRGDIKLSLLSPMGTRSVILPPRSSDMNSNGFHKWPFLSVQQWGEDPRGQWTLTFENVGSEQNKGTFHDWSLLLYGTSEPAQPSDPVYFDSVSSQRSPVDGTTRTLADSTSPEQQVTGSTHTVNVGNCHPECDQIGCYEAQSASACHSCRHYSMKMQNRAGTKCVSTCESGYYPWPETRECRQCLRSCQTCLGPDFCHTCHNSDFLVIADQGHFHHGQCLYKCPDGFDQTSIDGKRVCRLLCPEDCLTCGPGFSLCKSCKVDTYLTHEGRCVPKCPPTFFGLDSDRTCHKCAALCQSCTDFPPSACTECHPSAKFNDDVNMCLTNGHLVGDKCHPSCATCTGPGDHQCILCRNGSVAKPMSGGCTSCVYNQFYDQTKRVCVGCDRSCSGCKGPSPSKCHHCSIGHTNVSGVCLPCCKSDQLPYRDSCADCLSNLQVSQTLSRLTKLSIISCFVIVLLFFMVFGCLTCRSRRQSERKCEYKKLNNYDMSLNGCKANENVLDVLESEGEDSDPEDDTIFKKLRRES